MSPVPTETDVLKCSTRSATGGPGRDDQLGTLNFVPPATRRRAAAVVKEGASVTCSRPISTDITADTSFQPMR